MCCPSVLYSEQGYKDALMEVQASRVNCSAESKKREALESHITDLKRGITETSVICTSSN
jgi:hypothetical protein